MAIDFLTFVTIMNEPVKNIIFDLGGVLLNIDYRRTIEAFKTLGIADFDVVYSQARQTDLFDQLETGKIGAEVFCNGIRNLASIEASDAEIIGAWNAMLLDFPPERFDFLLELKSRYRTFLLSNTNVIHLEAFNQIIWEENNVNDLGNYFEKAYYSHDITMRKPDPEVFQFILDNHKLEANETLFIDDSIQHVEGAASIGVQALWLDTSKETVISKLGFLLT